VYTHYGSETFLPGHIPRTSLLTEKRGRGNLHRGNCPGECPTPVAKRQQTSDFCFMFSAVHTNRLRAGAGGNVPCRQKYAGETSMGELFGGEISGGEYVQRKCPIHPHIMNYFPDHHVAHNCRSVRVTCLSTRNNKGNCCLRSYSM